MFHSAGHMELDRLIKARAEKERKSRQITLRVTAVAATVVTALLGVGTFCITVWDKIVVSQPPTRIADVDVLPAGEIPAHSSGEKSDAPETYLDASETYPSECETLTKTQE